MTDSGFFARKLDLPATYRRVPHVIKVLKAIVDIIQGKLPNGVSVTKEPYVIVHTYQLE